ncbi:MAG TPA: adenine deaminase, partial [Bacillales bacterium]|nr:adenine deaminase [Bacillales bacterium]
MDTSFLSKQIAAASKRIPADVVIKNGKVVDVFSGTIVSEDVALSDGRFVGMGTYEGKEEIDAEGRYIVPGLIDGHVHIESAMVTPTEFAKVVVPHGVTTVIADPHEIANVSGADGIQFMLEDSENLPLDVYIALPSSVPATEFENAGAVLNAEQLRPFYKHKRVIGLGEVMDFPAVFNGSGQMMDKLLDPLNEGKTIDGHAAGVDPAGLNVYLAAGIRSDHEATTAVEARERLKRGMYLMIREGSVAKDLEALIGVVNERNARRCLFVTDDKFLDDLLEEGSVDHNIRLAVKNGIDPITAIQMATLNAAECFGLKQKGAIAPGYDGDFILLDDLEKFRIFQVYKNGRLVSGIDKVPAVPKNLKESIHLGAVDKSRLTIHLTGSKAHVIEIVPNSLITKHQVCEMTGDCFQASVEDDLLKLAVIERHHRTGNIGLGIVNGFGLQSGAIASTVAHDSHNLVVTGTNDDDMLAAVRELERMGGGTVVVRNGKALAALPLTVSGLMSDQGFAFVRERLEQLNDALEAIGFQGDFNP